MGKSAWDVAATLSVIARPPSPVDYMAAVADGVKKGIQGYRVGILEAGHPGTTSIDPDDHALRAECEQLYKDVIKRLQPVISPIMCPAVDELVQPHDRLGWDEHGWIGLPDDRLVAGDFGPSFEAYVAGLESSEIRSIEDLVKWNDEHPVSRRRL